MFLYMLRPQFSPSTQLPSTSKTYSEDMGILARPFSRHRRYHPQIRHLRVWYHLTGVQSASRRQSIPPCRTTQLWRVRMPQGHSHPQSTLSTGHWGNMRMHSSDTMLSVSLFWNVIKLQSATGRILSWLETIPILCRCVRRAIERKIYIREC